jgi:hypothetical protein
MDWTLFPVLLRELSAARIVPHTARNLDRADVSVYPPP